MTTSPHARIAADIRQRVADGRLRPGERVPSTRQLARDWGVALATAAKALTLLAREGVVVAEPRVGTVVAERRGVRAGPAPSGGELTRERVVRAAIEIADTEGLPELTMRAVAGRLGVATMSLYRHVGGKDDLVMMMVEAVIEKFALPAEPPEGWRARLEVSARVQWAGYRAHPWMAGVTSLTRPLPSPALLRHTEWVMAALRDTALDAVAKMHVHTLLYSYVQGIAANLELERRARAATGLTADEWMSRQEEHLGWITRSGRYGAFAGVVAELDGDFDLDLDVLFEFGLKPLLDGLASVIGPR
ncbi:GntR family transcriptional regulator [Nonomuraea antimicrobica]|uniref:GntR family transcriptional regulator n=1 Tax=Nonomuraea antimicrobica TaxID=561173 RepID=A0ABP7B1L2_9ACTN